MDNPKPKQGSNQPQTRKRAFSKIIARNTVQDYQRKHIRYGEDGQAQSTELLQVGKDGQITKSITHYKWETVKTSTQKDLNSKVERLNDVLSPLEKDRTRKFYEYLAGNERCENLAVVVVTHILPGREIFLGAVDKMARLAVVIPKGTSLDKTHLISDYYNVQAIGREGCANTEKFANHLKGVLKENEKVIIIDTGGYFANNIAELQKALDKRIIGVVETTENGHQRYQRKQEIPVISVARSPLKEAEDFQVGRSIVYSIEAILRNNGLLLDDKQSLVIGFGKIGKSIAQKLGNKTIIADIDPAKLIEAQAHGYRVVKTCHQAFSEAEIIFCATGHQALKIPDYSKLKKGCFVVTVTSADDELEMPTKDSHIYTAQDGPYLHKYQGGGSYFYLLNNGRTINFVHNAVVGRYIEALLGEELKAMQKLYQRNDLPKTLQTMTKEEQTDIGKKWLQAFSDRDPTER